MKLSVVILSALRNLIRNRKRSFLTMLGIIIGISSVITIVALGEGYKNKTIKDFTGENEGKVLLNAMFMPSDTKHTNSSIDSFNNYDKKELEKINEIKIVEYKYTNSKRGEFIDLQMRGIDLKGMASSVEKTDEPKIIGRNLSEKDNENSTRTMVIKESLLKNDFKDKEQLIGAIATLKGINFEIVGIIESDKDIEDSISLDPDIQIPKNTYNKFLSSTNVVEALDITLVNGVNVKDTIKKIENTLNEVGSRKDDGEYKVMDTSGIIMIMGTVLNTLTLFIAGVAGISLFIAGIGVMNMVYTSVSERTLEIGIKRSIGARKDDIRTEFLVEGIVITLVGGIIGYIIGIILANIISTFMDMIIVPNLFTASIAIGVSILVGVASSIIPANKAANANTIDILK